ncbi:unnamed protein product, partial [Coregonus sp. 'balchen']
MTDVVPPTALSEVQLRLLCHDDIDSGGIVGMIVAEIKGRTKVHREISWWTTQVVYILSPWGGGGRIQEETLEIGSLLLDSLKEHISTTAQDHCKAIYLHVLTTNTTAIHFYHNRDFRQHHYLPYYYSIRGVLKDGFTYVLLSPCSIPQRLYRQAQSLLRSLIPWSGIASKTGIQYSRTMVFPCVLQDPLTPPEYQTKPPSPPNQTTQPTKPNHPAHQTKPPSPPNHPQNQATHQTTQQATHQASRLSLAVLQLLQRL